MAEKKYTREDILAGCTRLGFISDMFDFIAERYTGEGYEDAPISPEQWKNAAENIRVISEMFQQMMDVEIIFNRLVINYEMRLKHQENTIRQLEEDVKRQSEIITHLAS